MFIIFWKLSSIFSIALSEAPGSNMSAIGSSSFSVMPKRVMFRLLFFISSGMMSRLMVAVSCSAFRQNTICFCKSTSSFTTFLSFSASLTDSLSFGNTFAASDERANAQPMRAFCRKCSSVVLR